jgi:hypothetical protein
VVLHAASLTLVSKEVIIANTQREYVIVPKVRKTIFLLKEYINIKKYQLHPHLPNTYCQEISLDKSRKTKR